MVEVLGKLESLGAIASLLSFFFDRKAINAARAKAAIDAAEKYMMVNEGNSPYDKYTPKQKAQYLKHYRKRFLAYN